VRFKWNKLPTWPTDEMILGIVCADRQVGAVNPIPQYQKIVRELLRSDWENI
jgi:hypothetical protein